MNTRRLRLALAALFLGGMLMVPTVALAEDAPPSPNKPSSTELIEQPKLWDGKTVTFRGEAIAQRMVRGDKAWIHLNDDGYYLKNVEEGSGLHGFNTGMPVWLPADLTNEIATYGDYKHEGEVVEVRGTFNAACAQHGGDMDIHATTLQRIIPGRRAIDQVRVWKVALAIVVSLLALILWQVERRSTRTLARGAVTRQRA